MLNQLRRVRNWIENFIGTNNSKIFFSILTLFLHNQPNFNFANPIFFLNQNILLIAENSECRYALSEEIYQYAYTEEEESKKIASVKIQTKGPHSSQQ